MKLSERKKEYLEKLQTAPNHILLGLYVEAQIPDDYDGGFTEEASWQARTSAKEFFSRLISTGWITQEQFEESNAEAW